MPSHTYRPWIGEARESHITDKELLERLESGPQTPFGIADGGDRVSTIRVQCHYLERLGYLNQTSIDVYERSSRGDRLVEDDSAFESEYVPIGDELKLEYEHTAEFGDLPHRSGSTPRRASVKTINWCRTRMCGCSTNSRLVTRTFCRSICSSVDRRPRLSLLRTIGKRDLLVHFGVILDVPLQIGDDLLLFHTQ